MNGCCLWAEQFCLTQQRYPHGKELIMNAWFLVQIVIMVAISQALISLCGFEPWHAYAWVAGGSFGLAVIGFL